MLLEICVSLCQKPTELILQKSHARALFGDALLERET